MREQSEAWKKGLNEMRKNEITFGFLKEIYVPGLRLISHMHTSNIPNPNSMR
jgi:hypothetical protein